jgi:hypothetical protein
MKYILAQRVRLDQRYVEGVGASGGQTGSGAGDGRLLPTSLLRSSRPKGGMHDTNTEEDCRDGRSGVVRRQQSS